MEVPPKYHENGTSNMSQVTRSLLIACVWLDEERRRLDMLMMLRLWPSYT